MTVPTRMSRWALSERNSGDDLLSQRLSPKYHSAQAGLTSVFGMGTGMSLPLWPPETFCSSGRAVVYRCNRQQRPGIAPVPLSVSRPLEPSIASTSAKPSAD